MLFLLPVAVAVAVVEAIMAAVAAVAAVAAMAIIHQQLLIQHLYILPRKIKLQLLL